MTPEIEALRAAIMRGEIEEEPREFTDAGGVVWRRRGACCRCDECCASGDPFTGKEGTCPLFKMIGGLGTCTDMTVHYRKIACDHWPSTPAHVALYPSCSYRFERV
jgi:hypothetical protein